MASELVVDLVCRFKKITCVVPQVRLDLMPDYEVHIPLSHFFVELPPKWWEWEGKMKAKLQVAKRLCS